MKKKTFGRRDSQSSRTNQTGGSDRLALDAAARQKLLDDLAEQARTGGQKEQAELKVEVCRWKDDLDRRLEADADERRKYEYLRD